MGYSLYITRRRHWHEEGPAIARDEWRSVVDADPELDWEPALGDHFATWNRSAARDGAWIAWDNGNLEAKHPDAGLIRKLAALAAHLGARVVGEDGESYGADGEPGAAPPPGLSERVGEYWHRLRASLSPPAAPDPGFAVGARVRGLRARTGTVTHIDLRAESGLGAITVRYDDGRSETHAAVAHSLSSIDAEPSEPSS